MQLGYPRFFYSWRPRSWSGFLGLATLTVSAMMAISPGSLGALSEPSFILLAGQDLEVADAMSRDDRTVLERLFSETVVVNGTATNRSDLVKCLVSFTEHKSLFRQVNSGDFRTDGDRAVTKGTDTFRNNDPMAADSSLGTCGPFEKLKSAPGKVGATYVLRYTYTWERGTQLKDVAPDRGAEWKAVALNTTVDQTITSDAPGSLTFTGKSIALGIGYSWGDGLLALSNGSAYKFRVTNIKVGSIGMSSIHARGTVYNLATDKIADFAGTYVAGEAGLTLGGGASGVSMVNENGVVIQLQSFQSGLNFVLGVGGVTIRLVD
jgi:hypothetical protein